MAAGYSISTSFFLVDLSRLSTSMVFSSGDLFWLNLSMAALKDLSIWLLSASSLLILGPNETSPCFLVYALALSIIWVWFRFSILSFNSEKSSLVVFIPSTSRLETLEALLTNVSLIVWLSSRHWPISYLSARAPANSLSSFKFGGLMLPASDSRFESSSSNLFISRPLGL